MEQSVFDCDFLYKRGRRRSIARRSLPDPRPNGKSYLISQPMNPSTTARTVKAMKKVRRLKLNRRQYQGNPHSNAKKIEINQYGTTNVVHLACINYVKTNEAVILWFSTYRVIIVPHCFRSSALVKTPQLPSDVGSIKRKNYGLQNGHLPNTDVNCETVQILSSQFNHSHHDNFAPTKQSRRATTRSR